MASHVEIWYSGTDSWECWDSGVGRALGFSSKDEFYKGVQGAFCYVHVTLPLANPPQGSMSRYWKALHWRFIDR